VVIKIYAKHIVRVCNTVLNGRKYMLIQLRTKYNVQRCLKEIYSNQNMIYLLVKRQNNISFANVECTCEHDYICIIDYAYIL